MTNSRNYRSYPNAVKAAISLTGRIDLFPDLEIPRSTAEHWTKKQFALDDPVLESMVLALNESREQHQEVKGKLDESEALLKLLKEVIGNLGFQLRWKHIDSAAQKKKILASITDAMVCASRDSCLEVLDMSQSRYKRWRREMRGCGLPDTKVCPKGSLNQLTFKEIQTMRELVTSEDYAHFPLLSLHYYAKRQGLLFCAYSTWIKYIEQYGWRRPRKKKAKKITRIGIRAKGPNQIWHMDVSCFVLPNGTKLYIQAVIDNFSRYVLAWQVMSSYDGARSAKLLESALNKSRQLKAKCHKLKLLVDGGGENQSKKVKRLEDEGYFVKQVAQFEISFSNSIVEALFRSLKNNYLYGKEIKSLKSLQRHGDFWFGDHNEKIPHTAFSGETPLERFSKTWTQEQITKILVNQDDAIKLRIKHNQVVFCQICKTA